MRRTWCEMLYRRGHFRGGDVKRALDVVETNNRFVPTQAVAAALLAMDPNGMISATNPNSTQTDHTQLHLTILLGASGASNSQSSKPLHDIEPLLEHLDTPHPPQYHPSGTGRKRSQPFRSLKSELLLLSHSAHQLGSPSFACSRSERVLDPPSLAILLFSARAYGCRILTSRYIIMHTQHQDSISVFC
jgi:hypothetical protein